MRRNPPLASAALITLVLLGAAGTQITPVLTSRVVPFVLFGTSLPDFGIPFVVAVSFCFDCLLFGLFTLVIIF